VQNHPRHRRSRMYALLASLMIGLTVLALPIGVQAAEITYANAGSILIPAVNTSGPANPYPSNINVGGSTGTVTKVTVTLNAMNHTFPDDIDILLVGPGGQRLLLMSDAGGSADLVNVTLTFDDAAATTLPDGTPIASGTYLPSNFGTGDTFPAPAPVGPYTDTELSIFDGIDPNGIWSLYVFDDVGGDVGNISGGWSLTLTTGIAEVPAPAAAHLFVSGLALLGGLAWRRARSK
jgi:subtilisin-like proprotein convertase family protein